MQFSSPDAGIDGDNDVIVVLSIYSVAAARVYTQVLHSHTSKKAKIGTVNLVVEHIVTTPT